MICHVVHVVRSQNKYVCFEEISFLQSLQQMQPAFAEKSLVVALFLILPKRHPNDVKSKMTALTNLQK